MAGIDWQTTAKRGRMLEALYLFACRLAWLRHGDERAHSELVRASVVAAKLLSKSVDP